MKGENNVIISLEKENLQFFLFHHREQVPNIPRRLVRRKKKIKDVDILQSLIERHLGADVWWRIYSIQNFQQIKYLTSFYCLLYLY